MPLNWVFDEPPASGARHGGLAQAQVFNNDIDTFVREVLQNARDQGRWDAERVVVTFRLEDISGTELDGFLEAANWFELEPHLDAVAEERYVTISPRVTEGLRNLRAAGRLRLLRIDDYGTYGLTGGEDEVDSNFNALCRHNLITSAGRRTSGGSFGLGKSVLWRFSEMSTVLFASGVDGDSVRQRFFGRTLLAWHKTGGVNEWEGSGWLGQIESRRNGSRATSIWDQEAEEMAVGCRMARVPAEAGTTIMIVGFDDPSTEAEESIEQLCDSFSASASRWFWPAIVRGEMEIVVEGVRDGVEVFRRQVQLRPEVRPFVLAFDAPGPYAEQLLEPGQVAERLIPLRVPPQRPGNSGAAKPGFEATATLRVRLSETGEDEHPNVVALQRGTGMVVRYWEPPRRVLGDQPFQATLLAGTAVGDDEPDQAAEEFLRAAEPVAHTEWVATTDRARAEYRGASAALTEFFDRLASTLADTLRTVSAEDAAGPEALRRFFPLPGIGGGGPAREPYRLSAVSAYVSDGAWVFGGSFHSAPAQPRQWRFQVALLIEQETGSASTGLVITNLTVSAGSAVASSEPWWEVTVPAGVQRVRFDGKAVTDGTLPPSALGLVKARLEVRPTGRRSS